MMVKEMWHVVVFAFVGVASCIVALGTGAVGAERPNILWITAEDMSLTLGCWGDTYADTPNIDRLARAGVRYTNTFATAPVCSPVRSCLITGCYATSLGTQRLRSAFPIPKKMRGFPALLRAAGYFCTNNVKTDYNTSNERAIIAASWDECSATAHWRHRPKGRPFFSIFNIMTSHQSRTMVWPYDEFKQKVQSRLEPDRIHDPARAPVPPYYPDTPVVRRTIARFYDCVSVMDQTVGKILKQLHEDGLDDDTIVFYYSDHGSGMPRHKRAVLDSGLHVPMIIHFPQKYQHLAPAAAGKCVDRLVSFVDFPPTVLSLCGVRAPDYMQGVPFLGRFTGKERTYVYGARDRVDEASDVARAVRDKRYLYIRNFMPHVSYNQPSAYPDMSEIRTDLYRMAKLGPTKLSGPQWHYLGPTKPIEELYDSETDPFNIHNLARDPKFEGTLKTMRRQLHAWILATRDLGFLPEEEVWDRLHDDTPYEMAKDPQRYPMRELVRTASLVGTGPNSLPVLVRALESDQAGVRYWAVIGLAALGADAAPARAKLVAALQDPSVAVRIESAGALARLGDTQRSIPVLLRALRGADKNAVLHAARTLELLGDHEAVVTDAMQAARRRAEGGGDLNMFIRFATDAFLSAQRSPSRE